MKKHLFLFFLLATSFSLMSEQNSQNEGDAEEDRREDYLYCRLNTLPEGEQVENNAGNFQRYIRQFRVHNIGGEAGVKVEHDDIELTMWNREQRVFALLEFNDQRLQTRYPEDMEEIELKLSPKFDLLCLSYQKLMELEEGSERMEFVADLEGSSDLYRYGKNVEFIVNDNLRFVYDIGSQSSSDRMRSLVFQDGSLYRSVRSVDRQKPWCIFQIEIKRDEDTVIQRRTRMSPVNVTRSEGRTSVISYNFVDFSTGQRGFDHPRFTPFTFECSIPKEEGLTLEVLEQLTGGKIGIESTLQ